MTQKPNNNQPTGLDRTRSFCALLALVFGAASPVLVGAAMWCHASEEGSGLSERMCEAAALLCVITLCLGVFSFRFLLARVGVAIGILTIVVLAIVFR
jgi:hypothetical protein